MSKFYKTFDPTKRKDEKTEEMNKKEFGEESKG